ncbi:MULTISPECIES: hypothetical protein [unclassified Streptomyces]|nr:hypothetical protein [Streptomyces sp. TSRI0281]
MDGTTHPEEDHGASAAEILRRAQADRRAQTEKDRARGGGN